MHRIAIACMGAVCVLAAALPVDAQFGRFGGIPGMDVTGPTDVTVAAGGSVNATFEVVYNGNVSLNGRFAALELAGNLFGRRGGNFTGRPGGNFTGPGGFSGRPPNGTDRPRNGTGFGRGNFTRQGMNFTFALDIPSAPIDPGNDGRVTVTITALPTAFGDHRAVFMVRAGRQASLTPFTIHVTSAVGKKASAGGPLAVMAVVAWAALGARRRR
ncbi:MAG: hypothetical protein ACYDBQ_00095 [Thermoplasmatota archaeon]